MSLTTLSYGEANKIIDLYSGILMRCKTLGTLHKFRYSDLKGYTIFDIDNSLKLYNAYQVFKSDLSNAKQKTKLEKFASTSDSACISFFAFFAPDDVAQKLAKLDFKTNSREMYEIEEGDYRETELWKVYSKTETHESFLDFCLTLGNSDPDFWGKIYNRLGITWDDRDETDLIYSIVLNKDLLFRKPIERVKTVENTDSPKVGSEISETFFSRHKRLFANLFTSVLFCFGLIFPTFRLILFIVFSIIGIVQLYYWIKEPINNNLNFIFHVVYEILYVAGIFLKSIGFYVLISVIVLWICQMIYIAVVSPQTETNSE